MRVDSWVWAVRLAKTRSAAAAECRSGHVKVNGISVKPAHQVKHGDDIRVILGDRERLVTVVRTLTKRVGADVAAGCFIDNTPPLPDPSEIPRVAERDRGAGRPTKRERRELDRFLGRE